jgi:hypothetical protein
MLAMKVSLLLMLAYRETKNKLCLSPFEYVLEDIGGPDVLICLGIVVGVLIIYIIIMMIRKVSER